MDWRTNTARCRVACPQLKTLDVTCSLQVFNANINATALHMFFQIIILTALPPPTKWPAALPRVTFEKIWKQIWKPHVTVHKADCEQIPASQELRHNSPYKTLFFFGVMILIFLPKKNIQYCSTGNYWSFHSPKRHCLLFFWSELKINKHSAHPFFAPGVSFSPCVYRLLDIFENALFYTSSTWSKPS